MKRASSALVTPHARQVDRLDLLEEAGVRLVVPEAVAHEVYWGAAEDPARLALERVSVLRSPSPR